MADLCKISICDPPETTDFDYIFGEEVSSDESSIPYDNLYGNVGSCTALNNETEYFIVEFGGEISSIIVEENDDIITDQLLGYIDELPVYSKISGKILKKEKNYIIGKYKNNEEEITNKISSLIEK